MSLIGLPIQKKAVEAVKAIQSYFLPLDYYNLDEDDFHPELVMEKYKDPTTGGLHGYSKWFKNDGSAEWRR